MPYAMIVCNLLNLKLKYLLPTWQYRASVDFHESVICLPIVLIPPYSLSAIIMKYWPAYMASEGSNTRPVWVGGLVDIPSFSYLRTFTIELLRWKTYPSRVTTNVFVVRYSWTRSMHLIPLHMEMGNLLLIYFWIFGCPMGNLNKIHLHIYLEIFG